MAGGYDDFFKKAQKASGTSQLKPKTAAQIAAQAKQKKSAGKINLKFPLKDETPEDRIRAELALRMQNRKRLAKGRRAKFPVGAAVFAVAMLLITSVGYFYYDQSEALVVSTLARFDIDIFGQAKAESSDSKTPAKNAKKTDAPKKMTKEEEKTEAQDIKNCRSRSVDQKRLRACLAKVIRSTRRSGLLKS